MDRPDVGGQDLAGLGDVHVGVNVGARVSTHIAAVRAVSDGYEGSVSRGLGGPSRGCVCDSRRVGGVADSFRGAFCMQQAAARAQERNRQRERGGDCASGQPPSHCCERVIGSAQAAIVPEATHLLVYLRCSEPLITGKECAGSRRESAGTSRQGQGACMTTKPRRPRPISSLQHRNEQLERIPLTGALGSGDTSSVFARLLALV